MSDAHTAASEASAVARRLHRDLRPKRRGTGVLRTLIVDNDDESRSRMRNLLQQERDINLIGETDNGDEALRLIRRLEPELLIMDVELPRRNGLSVASMIEPSALPEVIFVSPEVPVLPHDRHLPAALERRPKPHLEHRVAARELQRSRRSQRRSLWREHLRGRRSEARPSGTAAVSSDVQQRRSAPWVPASSSTVIVAAVVIASALVRISAQVVADVAAGRSPFHGPETDAATIAFGVGVLLAGTVVPLALVCRWGQVWPRWLPAVAGRAIPRWLVIGPVGILACGMTLVFAASMTQFLLDPAGSTASSDYPLLFWWFVLPAYLAWGTGLLVLTVAFWSRTRRSPGGQAIVR
jgi:CheY-like chemotaxis protein